MEEKKVCIACSKDLSVDEFHKDKSKSDGRVSKCKLCTKMNKGVKKPVMKTRAVSILSIRLARAINSVAKRMKIPVDIKVNNDTSITVTIKGESSDE